MQKYYERTDGTLDRLFGADDRGVKVVDDVNSAVYEGKALRLVGESGCGKSTAGRSFLHLTPPTGDCIVFSGMDLSGLDNDEPRAMRRGMQMVFQDPMSSLDPRMMAGQAIRESLDVHNLPESDPNVRGEADMIVTGIDAERISVTANGETDAIIGSSNGAATVTVTTTVTDGEINVATEERLWTEIEAKHEGDVVSDVIVRVTPGDSTNERRCCRVRQLLNVVDLEPGQYNRYPHELSGDQCQHVGIARALAIDPDFTVADEPISALDMSVQIQTLNLLGDLQGRLGLTYLFITHDLSVIRHISDHVAMTYLNEIVEVAATDKLFDGPKHLYTQALLLAIPGPDPAAETNDRIILEGDVSSPINPPSGCHFRTWCPQVIPPADLDIEQAAYRKVMSLRQHVKRETLDIETARDAAPDADNPSAEAAVSADGGTVDAVVDELRESHSSRLLLPELRGVVDRTPERVVADDWDEVDEVLHERFESVYKRDASELDEQTHLAAYHLADEQMTSRPRYRISPAVRRF